MTEALKEAVAKAICRQNLLSTRQPDDDATIDSYWRSFKAEARAALAAIDESGTHLIVERRHADDPPRPGAAYLIPIPRPLVKVLRKEAELAREGEMIVSGVDIDMAELLEDAAAEIERLRSMLAARPRVTGEAP